MKKTLLLFCALTLALVAGARSVSDVPNVHVADATRYVSNPDGVLSEQAVTRLDSILADVWRTSSAEVVVVAVDNLDGEEPNDYATQLFESWGIGKKDKDNGMLLLISRGDRRAVLRTGYGMEGVLPDALCGRIIRNVMAPYYKEGDYDSGTVAAVGAVSEILSKPEAVAEVMSKYANDSNRYSTAANDFDGDELKNMLLTYWCVMTLLALCFVGYKLHSSRKLDPRHRYNSLEKIKTPVMIFGCIGLGLPFIAYLWLITAMKKVRNSPRKCPNCGHKMHKIDEVHDNDYLSPAQDVEEKLDSVDYDVWLCDNCGEKGIIPFVNEKSDYRICPNCGARASYLLANRVVVRPSVSAPGRGVRIYGCKNCGKTTNVPYEIPKVAVPPVVIIPGGGRGFGGGGGFSGGSFGGGMTGGGGASGGW